MRRVCPVFGGLGSPQRHIPTEVKEFTVGADARPPGGQSPYLEAPGSSQLTAYTRAQAHSSLRVPSLSPCPTVFCPCSTPSPTLQM